MLIKPLKHNPKQHIIHADWVTTTLSAPLPHPRESAQMLSFVIKSVFFTRPDEGFRIHFSSLLGFDAVGDLSG
jgi:hypothetical protein